MNQQINQESAVATYPFTSHSPFGLEVGFCFLSAAFVMICQFMQSISLLLLKAVWSDEGKAILGSSMFYPTIAMTVLFIVARMVPPKVVSYCTGFCKRKALTAWRVIKMLLAENASVLAKLARKRAHFLASAKIMLGAIELFCL